MPARVAAPGRSRRRRERRVDLRRRGRSGRRGRAASRGRPTLKAIRPSGSRPTRAVAPPDRGLGAVDPANPGPRELAGEEEGARRRLRSSTSSSPLRDAGGRGRRRRAASRSAGRRPSTRDRRMVRSIASKPSAGRWGTQSGQTLDHSSPFSRWCAVVVVGAILISRGGGDDDGGDDGDRPAPALNRPAARKSKRPSPSKSASEGADQTVEKGEEVNVVMQTSCGELHDRPRHQTGTDNQQLLRIPRRRRFLRRPRPFIASPPAL